MNEIRFLTKVGPTTLEKTPIYWYKDFVDRLIKIKPVPREKQMNVFKQNSQLCKHRSQKQVVSFSSNVAHQKSTDTTQNLKKLKDKYKTEVYECNSSSDSS